MEIEMASGLYLHTKSTIKSTISTFAKGWNNIPHGRVMPAGYNIPHFPDVPLLPIRKVRKLPSSIQHPAQAAGDGWPR